MIYARDGFPSEGRHLKVKFEALQRFARLASVPFPLQPAAGTKPGHSDQGSREKDPESVFFFFLLVCFVERDRARAWGSLGLVMSCRVFTQTLFEEKKQTCCTITQRRRRTQCKASTGRGTVAHSQTDAHWYGGAAFWGGGGGSQSQRRSLKVSGQFPHFAPSLAK